MRVLQVVHTPRHSGAEILARDLFLSDPFAPFDKALCALSPSAAEFAIDITRLEAVGTRIMLPSEPLRRVGRVLRLRDWINQFRPDVILAHSVLPALYTRLANLVAHRPANVVSVLHSSDDYAERKLCLSEWALRRTAAAVVAVSEGQVVNYRRRVGEPSMVEVIQNGVDIARFRSARSRRDEVRANLGLVGTKVILQVGRVCELKGQHRTLEAVAPLLEEDPRLHVLFAGLVEEASYVEMLQSRIAGLANPSQVRLLGAHSDIDGLLAAADLFVMPSTSEAHSVTFLEALASGVPIVASNITPFGFASDMANVHLFDVHCTDSFRHKLVKSLSSGMISNRDLTKYEFEATCKRYARIVERLM